MSTITKPNIFSSGATIIASEHNSNFDTMYNDYNGSINNSNIAANAAIVDTKLAQITTANKVASTALTVGAASFTTGAFSGAVTISGTTDFGAGLLINGAATSPPLANSIYKENIVNAWLVYDGNAKSITNSFNVSSVTYNATGDYTVNWNTNFANANYAFSGTSKRMGGANTVTNVMGIKAGVAAAVGSLNVISWDPGSTAVETELLTVIATGDQL